MTLDTMLLAGAGVLLAALGAARLSSSVGLPSLLLFLFLGRDHFQCNTPP